MRSSDVFPRRTSLKRYRRPDQRRLDRRRGADRNHDRIAERIQELAADPALLRQALDNLVGNAIKYTPPGTTPSVRITSAVDDEPGWIKLEVSDNGMGIPEGDEERIFEEFHRGPRAGRSAGTGLGLSLSRRIVARHGGQLTARSNPEGGSTFTLILPAA